MQKINYGTIKDANCTHSRSKIRESIFARVINARAEIFIASWNYKERKIILIDIEYVSNTSRNDLCGRIKDFDDLDGPMVCIVGK